MANKVTPDGIWNLSYYFNRCNNPRCLRCRPDLTYSPHGPYFRLVRRNPDTMEREQIYLGKRMLPIMVMERMMTAPMSEVRVEVDKIRKKRVE